MAIILSFDTSSDLCTVAITNGDERQSITSAEPKSHALLLLSMAKELLESAQLQMANIDAFGVVCGPGSFTGIRIGVGAIQGLALALSKPVILLSSLELLAMEAVKGKQAQGILTCLKARNDEVYFAAYRKSSDLTLELLGIEKVQAPEDVILPGACNDIDLWLGAGNGWEYRDKIAKALAIEPPVIDMSVKITGDSLCALAELKFANSQTVTAEEALPSYLKEHMSYAEPS